MPYVYGGWDGARFAVMDSGPNTEPLHHLATLVHDQARALILSAGYTCIGAKHAVRHDAYRFALLPAMTDRDAAAALGHCLSMYGREADSLGEFRTFIGAFSDPIISDESHFEALVWEVLQAAHDLDSSPWDPAVSSDPTSADFEYSFGGRAYFIVGLHPASSRLARRFSYPTLVFNLHEQFEHLRAMNRMENWKRTNRARDIKLQGDVNPNLLSEEGSDGGDFGTSSAARQYSGRAVESDWACPFRPEAAH